MSKLLPIVNINEDIISKVKKIELEMLLEFDSICKKNNLSYFLFAGTLLGAVRHKGFIPWDDDIDVCMPRNDYQTFMRIGQKELSSKLFLQNHNTDKGYTLPFAKIRNVDTTFIEYNAQRKHFNQGVFIDIFPMDGYPSDQKRRKKYTFKQRMLKNVCYRSYLGNSLFSKLKSIPIYIVTGFKSAKRYINKYEKFVSKLEYGKTDLIMIFDGIACDKAYSYSSFNDKCKIEFEGYKLVSPKDYDRYLKEEFGDYMKLPPKENRVSGHKLVKVDLSKGNNK